MACLRTASSLRTISSVTLACISVLTIRTACAAERAAAEPRAVIELFTSQGCSSCPPADKLIAEYAHDPSVIALSLPVDYWDYLGWKDTLALSGHSNRQRAYAKSRGDREVYTPQVVVDGAVHALGSDKSAIERAIRQIRDHQAPLKVPVVISIAGDALNVSVPDAADEKTRDTMQAEVWLCPVSKSVQVLIGRGENSGHTITYSNVVRRWIKLGDWRGKAANYTVPLKDVEKHVEHGAIDSAVVMVQSGAPSAPKIMLGAAQLDLH